MKSGRTTRSIYSDLFEDYFLTAYYRLRGRQYGRYRRLLEESQWWPVEQIQAFQWRELQRLLEHVFRNVPYYQRKYGEAGACLEDIRSMDDFAKLPPLTRDEINTHRDEMKASIPTGKLLSACHWRLVRCANQVLRHHRQLYLAVSSHIACL